MSRTYRNVPQISGPEGLKTLKWVKTPKNSKVNLLSEDPQVDSRCLFRKGNQRSQLKEIAGAKEDWRLRHRQQVKALKRCQKAKFLNSDFEDGSWNLNS